MLQQFARGRPASRPSTNARARRRGSTLRKRAPIRSISSSSMPSQRPGSTLWPAATARSSRFVTNRDDQTVAVSHPAPTRRKITIYCWSTKPLESRTTTMPGRLITTSWIRILDSSGSSAFGEVVEHRLVVPGLASVLLHSPRVSTQQVQPVRKRSWLRYLDEAPVQGRGSIGEPRKNGQDLDERMVQATKVHRKG